MYKRAYFIGIAAYIIMFVLAFIFYKERTIFLDMAYNIFYIIKDKNFALQLFRFGDMVSQAPALLAVKAQLPLNAILKIYSCSLVLVYFLCYITCGSLLKRYDLALVILLLNILFAAHTFYWMVSQLPQALAMLMVLFAIVDVGRQKKMTNLRLFFFLAAIVTVAFYHPLVIFVITYAILFFDLSGYPATDRKMLRITAGLYVTVVLLKVMLFKTPYEHHSMSGMKNFVTLFPDYFTLFSNRQFLHKCVTDYYWIPMLFMAIVVFYKREKQQKKLWLFICVFGGYLMLVNISYPFATTPAFYIENLYLPLAVFIALPFVFDVMPALHEKKLAVPLFSLIVITGSVRLYAMHNIYTARLTYETKYLHKYGEQKVILKASPADAVVLQMLWGTPYEFLLLAESQFGKTASLIIDDTPSKYLWTKGVTNSLMVNWNLLPYKELPANYFHFTDTVSSYSIDR